MRRPMRKVPTRFAPFTLAWLALASVCVSSCGSSSGDLACSDGQFYLNGKPFNDCSQCQNPSACSFEKEFEFGQAQCLRPDGTLFHLPPAQLVASETATCAGKSATMAFGLCPGDPIPPCPPAPEVSESCARFCDAAGSACPALDVNDCRKACGVPVSATEEAWLNCMARQGSWGCALVPSFSSVRNNVDGLKAPGPCYEEYIAWRGESEYSWTCGTLQDVGDSRLDGCSCRLGFSTSGQSSQVCSSAGAQCCYLMLPPTTSGPPSSGLECVCLQSESECPPPNQAPITCNQAAVAVARCPPSAADIQLPPVAQGDLNCTSICWSATQCTTECSLPCGLAALGTMHRTCNESLGATASCPRPDSFLGNAKAPYCSTPDRTTDALEGTPCDSEWEECVGKDQAGFGGARGCVCVRDPTMGDLRWTCGLIHGWFTPA